MLCCSSELEPTAPVPPIISLSMTHAADVLDMPVDPNEPTYCLCRQVSYGEMIGCDNPDVSVVRRLCRSAMLLLGHVIKHESLQYINIRRSSLHGWLRLPEIRWWLAFILTSPIICRVKLVRFFISDIVQRISTQNGDVCVCVCVWNANFSVGLPSLRR